MFEQINLIVVGDRHIKGRITGNGDVDDLSTSNSIQSQWILAILKSLEKDTSSS